MLAQCCYRTLAVGQAAQEDDNGYSRDRACGAEEWREYEQSGSVTAGLYSYRVIIRFLLLDFGREERDTGGCLANCMIMALTKLVLRPRLDR